MTMRIVTRSPEGWRDLDRRADHYLHQIQKKLLPSHATDILAINMETGEYVQAATKDEAYVAFHKRWPDKLVYMVRADGGPVTKFHGK